MEFRDYLRILQRRWIAVVIITAAVCGASYFIVQSEPTFYSARAEILIKENPYLFPSSDMPALFPEYFTKSSSVPFIRSRPILEYAILKGPGMEKYFKTARDEDERISKESKDKSDKEKDKKEKDEPPVPRPMLNEAVNSLRGGLDVSQEKEQSMVMVAWTDMNPDRAVVIVNAVSYAFDILSKERQLQGVERAVEYIDTQRAIKSKAVDKFREELKKLGPPPKEELYSVEQKRLIDEITSLEKRTRETREEIAVLTEEIKRLSESLENPDTLLLLDTPDRELSALRSEIDSKERQLKFLRKDHTEEFDGIKKLKAEIDNLTLDYNEAFSRHVDLARFQAVRATIDGVRSKKQQLEQSSAKNNILATSLDEAHRRLDTLITTGPSPQAKIELENQERRQLLEKQMKEQEDSRANLERSRDQLNINKEGIVKAVERLEPAQWAAPNPKKGAKSLPLMAVAGLVVGIAAAFLLEYMNTSIRTEHDLKRYVNLPIFGIVLKIRNEIERLLANASPKSPLSEVFNTIGAMLESHAHQAGGKVFMVASSNAGEGKSTVTSDLAVALARGGARVLLLDADLRKAVLHKFFNVDNSRGLSTYLLGLNPAAAGEGETPGTPMAIDELLKPTEVENLTLLSAGPHPKNPVSLLKSDAFKALLGELRERADIVLIDVPPVRIAVDTLILSPLVDGIVLLVSAGETNKDDVAFAKRLIDSARGKMIGCILNKATIKSRGYYYYYYYYDSYRYYRQT